MADSTATTRRPSKRRPLKWSIDLTLQEGDEGYDLLQKCPAPLGMKKVREGEKQFEDESASVFSGGSSRAGGTTGGTSAAVLNAQQKQEMAVVKKKQSKAMSIALNPGRQLLMNGFMMYMSGKTLNIFSISTTSTAILSPIRSLFGIQAQFRPLEDPDGKVDLNLAKFLFVVLNLVWFAIGMYKMAGMRLLPTTSADWAGTVVWKEMHEVSVIPPS